MDPALVTERTGVGQGELISSNALINACDSAGAGDLSEQQLRDLPEGVDCLTALLANSSSAERQQVYRAAGVHLRCHEGKKTNGSRHLCAWGCLCRRGVRNHEHTHTVANRLGGIGMVPPPTR